MKCSRCNEVRKTINDAVMVRKPGTDNKTFWDALCMQCFAEIDPIHRKKGVKLGESYQFVNRRGK